MCELKHVVFKFLHQEGTLAIGEKAGHLSFSIFSCFAFLVLFLVEVNSDKLRRSPDISITQQLLLKPQSS